MSQSAYTRPLITFAFVKDEFDKTGDLVRGLVPLFAPVFDKLSGRPFSPADFCREVQNFYGLRMHPWVAEDWAPRFEQAGFLEGSGDQYARTYVCKASSAVADPDLADRVMRMLDGLVEYVAERLSQHKLSVPRMAVEQGVIERLTKPEFLNLLLKPNASRRNSNTLSLPGARANSEVDPEAVMDFILASRLLAMHDQGKDGFDLVARVAGGALVSEIVLNLRNPPAVGQKAKGSIVYLDSPLILDILDLADREQHKYAKDLLDDIISTGATLRTYAHNVVEIRGILNAAFENLNDIRHATGTVAYRVRTDGTARSRAQLIRANIEKKLRELKIFTVEMDKSTENVAKYFSNERIIDLIGQIRPFRDIFSREVDAKSIGGIARQVLSRNPSASVLSLPALFITKNAHLAHLANQVLVQQCNYSESAAPPFLTERQAAGLMWLALGGTAGDLPTRQLLANCATAITPRRDVIATIHGFLEEVDESAAQEFEVLMAEDRCAHYVMDATLGDAALVTRENAVVMLEEVKRRAVEGARHEAEERRIADLATATAAHQAEIAEMEARHAQDVEKAKVETDELRVHLEAELARQETALAQSARDQEEGQAQLEAQHSALTQAQGAILALEKNTLIPIADGARKFGFILKGIIIAFVCLLIGIVALVFSLVFGSLSGMTMGVVSAIYVLCTAVLSSLLAWHVPESLFGPLVTRHVQKRFSEQLNSRGASELLDRWAVNLDTGAVERIQEYV